MVVGKLTPPHNEPKMVIIATQTLYCAMKWRRKEILTIQRGNIKSHLNI